MLKNQSPNYKQNSIHIDQIKSLYIRTLLLPSFTISLCHTKILKLASLSHIIYISKILHSTYITCPHHSNTIHSYTDTCTLTHIYSSSFFIQLLPVRGFLEYSPQIQCVDNTFSEFLCIPKYFSFAQTSEEYLGQIQDSWIIYFSLGNLQISLYCLLFSSLAYERSDCQFDSFRKVCSFSLEVYTIFLLSFELREIIRLRLGCFFLTIMPGIQ